MRLISLFISSFVASTFVNADVNEEEILKFGSQKYIFWFRQQKDDETQKKKTYLDLKNIREGDSLPFSWENYKKGSILFLDDGGTWSPERPLLEITRNPTKENIENYWAWKESKIEFSRELVERTAIINFSKIYNDPILVFYSLNCAASLLNMKYIEYMKDYYPNFTALNIDDDKNKKLFFSSGFDATPTWVLKKGNKMLKFEMSFLDFMEEIKQRRDLEKQGLL
jgi:hypothetical protein